MELDPLFIVLQKIRYSSVPIQLFAFQAAQSTNILVALPASLAIIS